MFIVSYMRRIYVHDKIFRDQKLGADPLSDIPCWDTVEAPTAGLKILLHRQAYLLSNMHFHCYVIILKSP